MTPRKSARPKRSHSSLVKKTLFSGGGGDENIGLSNRHKGQADPKKRLTMS
jgi:hypothetical protein